MIDSIGIESFTFKKLATEIGSAEKSIYRYFDNKHNLLLFLTSWYWEWVHYLIAVNTKNIEQPTKKLDIIIDNIVHATSENPLTEYINENRKSIFHKKNNKMYGFMKIMKFDERTKKPSIEFYMICVC